MKHQPVESSAITSVAHDPSTQTIQVRFASGVTYKYANQDADAFMALLNASSKGRHVQTLGPGTKVSPDEGA